MPDHRIRIAYCIDNMQIGGTELNALRSAEHLDRSRFDLRVFCLQDTGPLLDRYAACGVPVHPLPLGSLHGRQALHQGRALAALLREHRVDVLHAHDVYSNVFGVPWARYARVRTIASRRWWEGMPGAGWRLASRVGYALADAVLANSEGVARLVETQERVPARKIHVVPNFVDGWMFDAPSADELRARREALGVPADTPVVGIVANLNPVKNHALLLRASARLRRQGTALHLVLVGDGTERQRLEALAAELDLADGVTFTGRLPNRPNAHHLFDVSVLTSDSEGLPNSLIEAMAAARPVVATRVGAVADVVAHGETGLLIEPGDEAALAAGIARLLAEPGEARQLGAAGRERAHRLHSPRAALSRLERLYTSLAGRAAPAVAEAAPPALTTTS